MAELSKNPRILPDIIKGEGGLPTKISKNNISSYELEMITRTCTIILGRFWLHASIVALPKGGHGAKKAQKTPSLNARR